MSVRAVPSACGGAASAWEVFLVFADRSLVVYTVTGGAGMVGPLSLAATVM